MEGRESIAAELASIVLSEFRGNLKEPELYLTPSQSLRDGCLEAVKVLHECVGKTAGQLPIGPLRELYTSEFDEDQVWEELQLTNEPAIHFLKCQLMRLGSSVRLLSADIRVEEEEEEGVKEEEEEEEEGFDDEDEELKENEVEEKEEEKRSGVDDGFFSLGAMEQYLEQADQLSDPGSEGSCGMLEEELSDSGSIDQPVYQDFFCPPQRRAESSSQLSAYEMKKKKVAEEISAIEEANIGPRSWQMSGESGAKDRPINSLLEEDIDFEPMTVPAPVVSEETTLSIEDIIKQRILDQVWDDVRRKVKPPEKPYQYQRARGFDQEKSKRSLAEVYEDEYLQQTEKQDEFTGRGVKQDPEHVEIEKLKKSLFLKLDSLTNFHSTPKLPGIEPQVVSNVSAVVMEEAIPSAVAQHNLLAPEEVQAKHHVPVKGSTELTPADRRRQRITKKWHTRRSATKQSVKGRGVRNKVQNFKMKSSKQFFTSLQQTASDT